MPAPINSKPAAGSQTLARGLAALRAVASEPKGLGVQELADRLGVHRTIAYRVLGTLADSGLVARGEDGRYRGGVGLLTLRAAGYEAVKHVAEPLLAALADEVGVTASLLVAEAGEAVALLVVGPRQSVYHIAFSVGSRHPLDRGAAGRVLSAAIARPGEGDPELQAVREAGYAVTFGEVEPGAWGLAAPLVVASTGVVACVNVITHREDLVQSAAGRVVACAREIEARLS